MSVYHNDLMKQSAGELLSFHNILVLDLAVSEYKLVRKVAHLHIFKAVIAALNELLFTIQS